MAYTADLKCTAARLLSPPVDERALADVTKDVEAQRTHVAAMLSAGGKATMASEHAPRIQSAGAKAGGKATVASHGAQMANGGKATMASEHAPRIQLAGGKATMASEHAPRIHSAGGKAGLGRKKGIYKKPHQTAAQAALAEKRRAQRAANRAAGAH